MTSRQLCSPWLSERDVPPPESPGVGTLEVRSCSWLPIIHLPLVFTAIGCIVLPSVTDKGDGQAAVTVPDRRDEHLVIPTVCDWKG
jgi:hypothetical protein